MIDNQKKEIRKKIKKLKDITSTELKKAKSEVILAKLEQTKPFQEANTVMFYWSMEDEVNTHKMVIKWAGKKRIILPSVKGENLILKEFKGIDNLIKGENYNIPEPEGQEFNDIDSIEVIIVPGVAFDRHKNRMGRGKAYYDKLLKTINAIKIGICFDFQLLDNVPVDEHDVKMDIIISNNEIIGV